MTANRVSDIRNETTCGYSNASKEEDLLMRMHPGLYHDRPIAVLYSGKDTVQAAIEAGYVEEAGIGPTGIPRISLTGTGAERRECFLTQRVDD